MANEESGVLSKQEKEQLELEKADERMWCQQDFAQTLKFVTYSGGLSIREIAEELRNFYDEAEREYLKKLL